MAAKSGKIKANGGMGGEVKDTGEDTGNAIQKEAKQRAKTRLEADREPETHRPQNMGPF